MKQKTKWSITTEVIIEAPAGMVWQVLTDLRNYPQWNPFFLEAQGEIKKGSRLKNTIRNGKGLTVFRPMVLNADAPRYFDWLGTLWHKTIFAGHHYFHLEPLAPNLIKLTHGENFSGLLAGVLFRKIKMETRKGFVQMNEALKIEAEKLFVQSEMKIANE